MSVAAVVINQEGCGNPATPYRRAKLSDLEQVFTKSCCGTPLNLTRRIATNTDTTTRRDESWFWRKVKAVMGILVTILKSIKEPEIELTVPQRMPEKRW